MRVSKMAVFTARKTDVGDVIIQCLTDNTMYEVVVSTQHSCVAANTNEAMSLLANADGTYTSVCVESSAASADARDAMKDAVLVSEWNYSEFVSPEAWQLVYGKVLAPL